jgi:hypothetical protein
VQPGNTAGATWIWYRVYEDGNPDNFVDVFFSLYTPGTLFTNAPEEIKLKAFPNPVVSDLFIENELALPLPSRMINSAGQLMWQGVVSASGSQQIIVSTWPAGVYFLHHENGTQKILIGQ